MNKKSFTGIAFSLMLFLLITCNAKAQETQSTVSVSGVGTVLAQPDMVLMNVNFSHIAPTTKAAKEAAEKTMRQILQILQEENIEDKFIKTISLNYDVATEFRTGRRVRLGERVQQTVVVTVNDIINRPERFSSLLEKVTAIDKVQVSNIRFDIENKTELFKQSRELAFQKAFEKATQYAELSGLKIDKVKTISEVTSRDFILPRAIMSNVAFDTAADFETSVSTIPAGEREVTSEINITFLLK